MYAFKKAEVADAALDGIGNFAADFCFVIKAAFAIFHLVAQIGPRI